jgi:putative acetyltransferase
MSDPAIALAVESPRQAEVTRLLEALDAYQGALYPPESNHFLDVEALAAPNVRFIVARREGLGCLRLETGIYQPEALGLYRSAGYAEREAFAPYAPDPLSVFMEKIL